MSAGSPPRSLQEELDAYKHQFLASIPRFVASTIRGTTDQLVRSGIAGRALRVGERAPAFSLPDATGNIVTLPALLTRGPVVLTFYRGVW